MKIYFLRQDDYLYVEEQTFQNALDLAQLFGCPDSLLVPGIDFSSHYKGHEYDLKGAMAPSCKPIHHIPAVQAQALALSVERALQANEGAMYAIAIALDECMNSTVFKDLILLSHVALDSAKSEIYRTHVEPNAYHRFFQKFVDFVGDLNGNSTYSNRFSQALRDLMCGTEREKLRQLVAFCRCGGFSICQSLPG